MRMLAAVIAMAVAVAYYFVWPGRKDPERVRQRPLWSRIVLRWFHALTWVLLALACLFWIKLAAVMAGVVYLVFMITLAQERHATKGQ